MFFADKALIEVLPNYYDYADVFSPNLEIELPKYTGINDHVIKLKEAKQPLYSSIYSLDLIELETLKTGIIWSSKSSTRSLIFFDQK